MIVGFWNNIKKASGSFDHLKENEKYDNFCFILKKAKIGKKAGNMLTTLSTYGSYTCFAPTNEAVDSFIAQQYALYLEGGRRF